MQVVAAYSDIAFADQDSVCSVDPEGPAEPEGPSGDREPSMPVDQLDQLKHMLRV